MSDEKCFFSPLRGLINNIILIKNQMQGTPMHLKVIFLFFGFHKNQSIIIV